MRLRVTLVFAVVVSGLVMAEMVVAAGKPASVEGSIYRGDKSHPVSGALIILLDDRHSGEGPSTKTDENGNYRFPNVSEGRYTISIRTFYDRQEDAPCHLLMAKTKDKNSTVLVLKDDQGKFVEQVFVKDFSVKGGKAITRDLDIACSSMFG
jgi:hypothetical protein